MNNEDTLLGIDTKQDWMEEWIGMPDFDMKNLMSWQSVIVHFANQTDREVFAKLIGRKLTDKTRALWYPREEITTYADKGWVSRLPPHQTVPRYPIYIPTKGRWKSRKTSRYLEEMKVPYYVVVEPQEYKKYAKVIDPEKILTLPKENFGEGCSIPARNWIWKHSRKSGAERHWVIDDNIDGFFRLTDNLKVPVKDGLIFRAAEEFTDRYSNVAMSGFNYFMFASRKCPDIQPFTKNTRVYSCILLSNTHRNKEDEYYTWRGRYNEDTDLSLRILKDGWCTILFNAFLACKTQTMTMKGGNTESLYKIGEEQEEEGTDPENEVTIEIKDGRLKMAESLKEQHPDCVEITRKWDRWQHHVDYSRFKSQKLKKKPDREKLKINYNQAMLMQAVAKKKKSL